MLLMLGKKRCERELSEAILQITFCNAAADSVFSTYLISVKSPACKKSDKEQEII